ncbi:hypothetical protein E7Z59_13465 [Robertkochia marina]|uniref:Glycosyl hydrolase n=1 Tax=Robertkochia marina TaxID=1227945 RepID=A0A4S3M000_9FLAO|nr:glycoside hydrolase family 88 protein [Robertkochia marina]THD66781.1 hypothetical protein E7Z59_13465 [Robertkochia marina]TRZ41928.1 hypothetical protein D3A96_12615 [Robertkochia marina]
MIVLTLLALTTLTLYFIIGIDIYFYFREIYSRIGIGRWHSRTVWEEKINTINRKWLLDPPIVKLTDQNRHIAIDKLNGRYKSNVIQSWQEAGILLGQASTQQSSQNIQQYLTLKIDPHSKTWKAPIEQVDQALLAYAISYHLEYPEEYKNLFDDTLNFILKLMGNDGTIMYRSFLPDVRFVDTLGFICPFLVYYGKTFNEPQYIDLAIKQLRTYQQEASLESSNLVSHAYDIQTKVPLGIYGWGRGMGWYILGLLGMYKELPDNRFDDITFIKGVIIKTSETLLPFQNKNGGFNSMIPLASSRYDSSITCLAGKLFLAAFQVSENRKFLEASEKCINRLMGVTRKTGAIDYCQGDTKGIGIYSNTFDVMPFTQGLTVQLVQDYKFIRQCSESLV